MQKSMQAFMHQMQAGSSSNVRLLHVLAEESSASSSSDFDPNDLVPHNADPDAAHDGNPNADPMDPDYH